MKISTFVSFILLVSVVIFIFASMADEANTQFSDANLNTSEWSDKYDYVSSINSTVGPLRDKFAVIEDENQGFFTKLAAGITAIPYAVIIFPKVVFGALNVGGKLSVGLLTALAIPGYIITALIVSLLVWALFKLLEFFQRNQV